LFYVLIMTAICMMIIKFIQDQLSSKFEAH
jgi:hypothetical protein